jgi:hypothetical protein
LVKYEIYAQKLDYVNQGVLEDFIRKKLKTYLLQCGNERSVTKYILFLPNKIGDWGLRTGKAGEEELITNAQCPIPHF